MMSILKIFSTLVLLAVFSASASASIISYTIRGTLLSTSTVTDYWNLDNSKFAYTLQFDTNTPPVFVDPGEADYAANNASVSLTERPNGFADITAIVKPSGSPPSVNILLRNFESPYSDEATFAGGDFPSLPGLSIGNFIWLDGPDFWTTGEVPTLPTSFTNTTNLGGSIWLGGQTNYAVQGLSLEVSEVPVPPAVWLFGSGLIGLIGIAKRKKL